MRTLIFAILLLASTSHAQFFHNMILRNQRPTPAGGGAGPDNTPQLVQKHALSNTYGVGQMTVGGTFRFRIGEPTQAGNTMILMFTAQPQSAVNLTATVSDDAGDTWTQMVQKNDGTLTDNQMLVMIATNIGAGTRIIQINNTSGQTLSHISGHLTEWCNVKSVNPSNTVSSNVGLSATVTSGSMTPTVSQCLLVQFGFRHKVGVPESGLAHLWTPGSQTDIHWRLISADLQDGVAVQWGLYTNTTAINPTFTMADSKDFMSATIALQPSSGAQGSPISATAMTVAGVMHQAEDNASFPKTNLWQFPTVGNLGVITMAGGSSNWIVTNITDNLGNTWTERAGGNVNQTGQDTAQIWYCQNMTPSDTLALTVKHFGTSPGHWTMMFHDVVHANASSYDTSTAGASDFTANSLFLTNPPAITPSVAGGILFACAQWEFNTATNLSTPSGSYCVAADWDGEGIDGPVNLDQNGGWAFYHVPSTSPITMVWKFKSSTDPFRQNAAMSAYFKP